MYVEKDLAKKGRSCQWYLKMMQTKVSAESCFKLFRNCSKTLASTSFISLEIRYIDFQLDFSKKSKYNPFYFWLQLKECNSKWC